MYKIRIVLPPGWTDSSLIDELVLRIAELTPEDIRTEIYNQGYQAGRGAGYNAGIADGYKEGKQFITYDRDPYTP